MRSIACLIALGLFAGCSRGSGSDFLAEAKVQVQRFFVAAASEDCATIRSMLEKVKTETDCEGYLHMWHEDGIALVDIVGAERDGRDRSAVIVRVQMQTKGKTKELLVRAVRKADRWMLVF